MKIYILKMQIKRNITPFLLIAFTVIGLPQNKMHFEPQCVHCDYYNLFFLTSWAKIFILKLQIKTNINPYFLIPTTVIGLPQNKMHFEPQCVHCDSYLVFFLTNWWCILMRTSLEKCHYLSLWKAHFCQRHISYLNCD